MPLPWLAEAGNPPLLQDASEFGDYLCRIGDVMKRIETHNPIHRLVGQVNPASVEQQKDRLVDHRSDEGVLLEEAPANVKGGSRRVTANHLAVQLRQDSREPAGSGSKFQHPHRLPEVQARQQEAQIVK